MTVKVFLIIRGRDQGAFLGPETTPAREKASLVHSFNHHLSHPVPGQDTKIWGHSPLTITKEVDTVTMKLYRAWAMGEDLNPCRLLFYEISPDGSMVHNPYTIQLTKARVVEIKFEMHINEESNVMRHILQEQVSFIYESIMWMHTTVLHQDDKGFQEEVHMAQGSWMDL